MKGKHDSQQQQRGASGESHSSVAPSVDHEAQRQEPHSGNATSESESNKSDSKDRQFRKINMVLMLVFTGALVLVNIIYAYFAGGQWTAMDKKPR